MVARQDIVCGSLILSNRMSDASVSCIQQLTPMNTILMDTAPPVITDAPRMNILLIETSVNDYATIVGALKPNVLYVLFDSAVDTFASLNAKIACVAPTEGFDAVGIVKHGNATGADYKLLEAQVTPAVLRNVEAEDPLLSSWSELTDFFGNLKTLYTVSTIDLLSCALYGNPGWVYGLIQLEKTLGVNFRASTNNVGNIASGGDWLMESDGVDIQTVYFTDAILGYKFLFASRLYPSFVSATAGDGCIELVILPGYSNKILYYDKYMGYCLGVTLINCTFVSLNR